jgi:hypothetical protein
VRERGVADPEIVDGEPSAHLLDFRYPNWNIEQAANASTPNISE